MTTLLLVAGGFLAGWVAKSIWNIVLDRRDAREDRRAELIRTNFPAATESPSPPEAHRAPEPQGIRTKRCPAGWSAKHIIGYYAGGSRWHPSVFPNGLADWDALQERNAA